MISQASHPSFEPLTGSAREELKGAREGRDDQRTSLIKMRRGRSLPGTNLASFHEAVLPYIALSHDCTQSAQQGGQGYGDSRAKKHPFHPKHVFVGKRIRSHVIPHNNFPPNEFKI